MHVQSVFGFGVSETRLHELCPLEAHFEGLCLAHGAAVSEFAGRHLRGSDRLTRMEGEDNFLAGFDTGDEEAFFDELTTSTAENQRYLLGVLAVVGREDGILRQISDADEAEESRQVSLEDSVISGDARMGSFFPVRAADCLFQLLDAVESVVAATGAAGKTLLESVVPVSRKHRLDVGDAFGDVLVSGGGGRSRHSLSPEHEALG